MHKFRTEKVAALRDGGAFDWEKRGSRAVRPQREDASPWADSI